MAVYEGRLVADGNGNLLADERRLVGTKTVTLTDTDDEPILDANGQATTVEVPIFKFGKNHNKPVAYDEESDSFVFVKSGEPSHNDRHHKNLVGVVVTQTQDPEMPGYAGTADNPTEGHEHHFGVLKDDPHYEEGAELDGVVTNTRARQHPDSVAARISGHTHQHKMGGDE